MSVDDKYILDGKTPVVEPDLIKWGRWLEDHDRDRIVAKTDVGEARVSTVFLGLDHQYGDGPPLLFETLIVEGPHDGDMWRCSTWEEAEAQHENACTMLRAEQN